MIDMFRHWKIYISVICFILFIQFPSVRTLAVDQDTAFIQDQTDTQNIQQGQTQLVQLDQNTQTVQPDTTPATQTVHVAAHQVEYTGDREFYAKTNNNNVRTSPDVGAEILISAPPGNDLKIWSVWESSTGEKWYEVEYLGNRGYVWGGAVTVYENETVQTDDEDAGDDDAGETDGEGADSVTDDPGTGFKPASDVISALPTVAPITVERYDDSQASDDADVHIRDTKFKRFIRRPFDKYTVLFLFLIILGGGCVFFVFKRLQYELRRYRAILKKSAPPVASAKRRKPKPPVKSNKKGGKKENYDFIDMLDD